MTPELTNVPFNRPEQLSLQARRWFFVMGSLWCASLAAQQPSQLPTPTQAESLLQQNPQLGDMIRQRLEQSGLTPDQIRAKLQAAGYPDSLLNAYLGPAQSGQPAPTPGPLELSAIQALGIRSLAPSLIPMDTGLVSAAARTLQA